MELKKITYIAAVARSGTSWLGQIFDSALEVSFRFQPLFSYEFKGRLVEDSTAEEIRILMEELFLKETPFLTQEDKRISGEYPQFCKDKNIYHLVFKENRYQYLIEPIMRKDPRVKLVALIRNPNAVINSWMKNPKEFPKGSKPLAEWRHGNCKNEGPQDFFGYYKWKEVANLYLDLMAKYPNRVYLVQYEQLVNESVKICKKLFEFAGIEYGEQTARFVENPESKHSESYYSVYKKKT